MGTGSIPRAQIDMDYFIYTFRVKKDVMHNTSQNNCLMSWETHEFVEKMIS